MKWDDWVTTRDELERREWSGGWEARQGDEIKHSEHPRIRIFRLLSRLSGRDNYDQSQKSDRVKRSLVWWSWPGLNRRPRECHSRALPTAPQPHPGRFRDQINMENCGVEQRRHANTQCRASQPTDRCLTVSCNQSKALNAKYLEVSQ